MEEQETYFPDREGPSLDFDTTNPAKDAYQKEVWEIDNPPEAE